jgi:hypothetical protein
MREVHLCQVHDWLFVAFPSEKRAFREKIVRMAIPFDAFPEGPKYWMPADLRFSLFDLIDRHYPDWVIREWGFSKWSEIPPWAREGVKQMLAQTTEGSPAIRHLMFPEEERS